VTIFNDRKICVEIRSLNGKAMDLSTRIAPQFKGREMEIRTLLTSVLERGKVDFALWVEQGEKADMPSINQAVVQGYVEQMTELSKNTGLPMPQNLFEVLVRLPEVIARKEVYEVTDEEWAVVLDGVKAALADLVAFRKQEGEALAAKFKSKISNISQLLASVESFEKERVEKLNTADANIFTTEKNLKEYGDKIPAEKKSAIESALAQLKEAHKNSDIAAIDTAMEALNAAWQAASQDIYAAQQAQQGAANAGANPNAGQSSQQGAAQPEDVEFEEVK
jgi:hypothetical protein